MLVGAVFIAVVAAVGFFVVPCPYQPPYFRNHQTNATVASMPPQQAMGLPAGGIACHVPATRGLLNTL